MPNRLLVVEARCQQKHGELKLPQKGVPWDWVAGDQNKPSLSHGICTHEAAEGCADSQTRFANPPVILLMYILDLFFFEHFRTDLYTEG